MEHPFRLPREENCRLTLRGEGGTPARPLWGDAIGAPPLEPKAAHRERSLVFSSKSPRVAGA